MIFFIWCIPSTMVNIWYSIQECYLIYHYLQKLLNYFPTLNIKIKHVTVTMICESLFLFSMISLLIISNCIAWRSLIIFQWIAKRKVQSVCKNLIVEHISKLQFFASGRWKNLNNKITSSEKMIFELEKINLLLKRFFKHFGTHFFYFNNLVSIDKKFVIVKVLWHYQ